jgi:hypothetical protein
MARAGCGLGGKQSVVRGNGIYGRADPGLWAGRILDVLLGYGT